jgi:hypothetical protein
VGGNEILVGGRPDREAHAHDRRTE